MRLHSQGVKLPPLGSVQDKVFRQFAVKEAELEAKRTEFQMLMLLTNPQIADDSRWREWRGTVGDVWKQYVGMLFNMEVPKQSDKDKELIDYYNKVVKTSELKMYKDRNTGALKLLGTETLLKPA